MLTLYKLHYNSDKKNTFYQTTYIIPVKKEKNIKKKLAFII